MILMVLSWSSDDVFPWSLDIKVDEEDIRLKTLGIPNLRSTKVLWKWNYPRKVIVIINSQGVNI